MKLQAPAASIANVPIVPTVVTGVNVLSGLSALGGHQVVWAHLLATPFGLPGSDWSGVSSMVTQCSWAVAWCVGSKLCFVFGFSICRKFGFGSAPLFCVFMFLFFVSFS